MRMFAGGEMSVLFSCADLSAVSVMKEDCAIQQ